MTHSPQSPEHEEEQPTPRQPVTARTFRSLVDQRIAAAEAAGAFRDLPGAGKPLKLDDDAPVPAEDRAAFRLLKNAGFAAPWIELQKEIRAEQEALNNWLAQQQQHWSTLDEATQERLRADYRRRLVALNRQISSYNLMAPRSATHLPTFRVERELARLDEA
jgi:DnaJ homolog subfamily C member 28